MYDGMKATDAMVKLVPMVDVLGRLEEAIGRLANAAELVHNGVRPVLKTVNVSDLATPTDPMHEDASELYRNLSDFVYRIESVTTRLHFIRDTLEI